MRIIADCGSTSCKWIIEGNENRLIGQGINPSVMSPKELNAGFESNQKLFTHVPSEWIQEVRFYGTGCINEKSRSIIGEWLGNIFPNAEIIVDSDLFGACLAVHTEAQKVAVGILGTGSAAAGFDGTDIARLTPSLGYQLADEGAGSDIGRRLLLAFLYGELPKELFDAFYARFPDTETNYVINKVYTQQAGSAFLAQHTQLAVDYPEHAFIRQIVSEAFSIFIRRHLKPLLNAGYDHAGIIGSVGFGFKNILEPMLLETGFKSANIVRDPLDSLPSKVWKETNTKK